MTLVLTLLCRDEADILESMLRFHFDQGVDLVIATDNGSVDGSLKILQRFERSGRLRLLQEAQHIHDQAIWVTRMARMAATDHQASWVINSDADEFWWPRQGTLHSTLASAPSHVAAYSIERTNFLPPARASRDRRPCHQSLTLRERQSFNYLGRPLPPKVIHRANAEITISDGNHSAALDDEVLPAMASESIEILHMPIRSYEQLERKIRQGAEALNSNTRVVQGVGDNWRRIYSDQLLNGTLPEYYDSLRPNESKLADLMEKGDVIDDTRLKDALKPRV